MDGHRRGLAADLHLASASRTTDLVEYRAGSPFIAEIVERSWKLDFAGMRATPTSPCPGVSLNLDAVERYSAKAFGLVTALQGSAECSTMT